MKWRANPIRAAQVGDLPAGFAFPLTIARICSSLNLLRFIGPRSTENLILRGAIRGLTCRAFFGPFVTGEAQMRRRPGAIRAHLRCEPVGRYAGFVSTPRLLREDGRGISSPVRCAYHPSMPTRKTEARSYPTVTRAEANAWRTLHRQLARTRTLEDAKEVATQAAPPPAKHFYAHLRSFVRTLQPP